jgi:hypothetical protein
MQSPTYDLDNCVLKKSIHRFVSVLEVELTYSLFYSTHAISIGALLLDKGARAIGVLLPPRNTAGKKAWCPFALHGRQGYWRHYSA